ncbi:MAG: hypothetical protein M3Q19_14535 [Pseudomonadota bacterium]|nr:hypothetical protein [Pseudomonadota bacterium]
MKPFAFWLLILSFVGLSTSVYAQSDPGGWSSLVNAIGSTDVDKASTLNSREFTLVKPGIPAGDTLQVTPVEAFQVQRSGDTYKVRITDASKLLESVGPLLRRFRRIGWRSTAEATSDFDLSLAGVSRCTSKFTFRQVGGAELDLSQAVAAYKTEFLFSNPAAISQHQVEGRGLTVDRAPGDNRPVTLALQLSLSGEVVGRTDPIPVPFCAARSEGPTSADWQPRTPGQCMVVLRQRDKTECDTCGAVTVNFDEEYVNSCSRPVRCTMRWELRYATSKADYDAGASDVKRYEIRTITFRPNQPRNEKVKLAEPSSHSHGYWWTTPITPAGAYPGFQNNYYACEWAD